LRGIEIERKRDGVENEREIERVMLE